MRARHLQRTLEAMGVVATIAGADAVLRGAVGVPGAGHVSANVDSELRYYGAWYGAMGTLLFRAARSPAASGEVIESAGWALLVGAGGRLLSWRRLGPPGAVFRWLLAIEILLGAAVLPMHRRLLRNRS